MTKIIKYKFKPANTIGKEEARETLKVMKSGALSSYLGSKGPEFLGGKYVKKFEKKICEFFNVKYAISVNSWTSGLYTIMGAVGIKNGDEIITSPWTMCCTATSALHWNGIPVFCDIEPETFNINANIVEKLITKRTKAIVATDILGHGCDIEKLKSICRKKNIYLITDSAQAPAAKDKLGYVGTNSDIGGFSLNYHKHIHSGEGGVIVTNDKNLARRCQLIRNHAEAVIPKKNLKKKEMQNMVGHNFRMGELECAIAFNQIKKLKKFVNKRNKLALRLTRGLKDLQGLQTPIVKKNNFHVFYNYSMILDYKKINLNRKKIVSLLEKEGVQGLVGGYANIHLLPVFQKKFFQHKNFPWSINKNVNYSYKKGTCPVAEELVDNSYFHLEMHMFDLTEKDIDLIILAFQKVWKKIST